MRQRDNTLQPRELELIDISRTVQNEKKADICETCKIPVKSHENRAEQRRYKRQLRMERRQKRKRRIKFLMTVIGLAIVLLMLVGFWKGNGSDIATAVSKIWQQAVGDYEQGIPAEEFATHPEWKEDFLTKNEYSRPGYRLLKVTNIFVHYTANPGSSAAQNRSYFEQQKDTHERSVSSHFIIGYEGEILQCVPLDEVAYAVQTRNYDSISIECCHLTADGSFTEAIYDSLIELLSWLLEVYDLETEDILRHYDCGGKKCPLYYTEHEDAWEQLKKDVDKS